MARQLGEQLVASGVLTPKMLAQALERQKITGQKLGECLVRQGLDETPVLRLLAQQLGTRFVSTAKLAQARIEPAVLERVPVRLAEGFDFVPIRIDAGVLYVAMSEPQRARALEEIAAKVGVDRVQPFVAIRRSVRAAIRKHYYSDPHAFETMRDDDVCPHCGAPVGPRDFQCSRCELLLVQHPDDLPERDNVSLVRALLSEPDGSHGRRKLEPPHRDRTAVYTLAPTAPSGTLVPRIVARFDLVQTPLHPFEAFVLSYVDGRTTLAEIASLTQLRDVELRALFESLVERKVVEVGAPPPRPVREPQRAVPVSPPSFPFDPPPPPVPSKASPSPSGRNPVAPPPGSAASPGVAAPRQDAIKILPVAEPQPARGGNATDNVLQQAVSLERAGKVEEAIGVLTAALDTLKNPAPLYNRLGLILLDQYRDYERATYLLKKATELDPSTSVYMMNLYAVLSLKAEATNPGKKKKAAKPPAK